jgi:hypothetical protein
VIASINQWVEEYPAVLTWLNLSDRSLSFLLMPVIFSLMFWFFPATKISIRDVLPAGVLTSLLVAGSRYSDPGLPAVFHHQRSLRRSRIAGRVAGLDLHHLAGRIPGRCLQPRLG